MTKKPKNPGVSDTEQATFKADAPARSTGRTLKVRRVGNSLGVVLPKEVLAKLRVGEGDELTVTDTPDGVALTADDSETAELMRLADDIMRKRRKVLKALAQ
ncbi:MAG: AbrB/MazE/SpoVT family DNA-binding domain-containing protein [Proteobacteria bacterium]|nr:AbrB/MazE/SpoVT family DNA-binding domain-containing protein [Pseudomonadota bacterium]